MMTWEAALGQKVATPNHAKKDLKPKYRLSPLSGTKAKFYPQNASAVLRQARSFPASHQSLIPLHPAPHPQKDPHNWIIPNNFYIPGITFTWGLMVMLLYSRSMGLNILNLTLIP